MEKSYLWGGLALMLSFVVVLLLVPAGGHDRVGFATTIAEIQADYAGTANPFTGEEMITLAYDDSAQKLTIDVGANNTVFYRTYYTLANDTWVSHQFNSTGRYVEAGSAEIHARPDVDVVLIYACWQENATADWQCGCADTNGTCGRWTLDYDVHICSDNSDCDDGNNCTIDECLGYCEYVNVTPECPNADTVRCGVPINSSNGCGTCSGEGTKCDEGSCVNGSCEVIGCSNDTDCDDGNNCTENTCGADGNCSLTTVNPICPGADTVACGDALTPTNGCGTCTGTGTQCTQSGYVCQGGTCVDGQSSCTDDRTDEEVCAAVGAECDRVRDNCRVNRNCGECTDSVCEYYTKKCVECTSTDTSHCADGEVCVDNSCTSGSGGGGVECTENSDCSLGRVCVDGVCTLPGSQGFCPIGCDYDEVTESCCGHQICVVNGFSGSCVECTADNTSNCAADQICQDGDCVDSSCPSGTEQIWNRWYDATSGMIEDDTSLVACASDKRYCVGSGGGVYNPGDGLDKWWCVSLLDNVFSTPYFWCPPDNSAVVNNQWTCIS